MRQAKRGGRPFRHSIAIWLGFLLTLSAFAGCGEDDGEKADTLEREAYGVIAVCDRMVDCCDRISDEICLLNGEPEQIKTLCEMKLNQTIQEMENSDSPVCPEWFDLQADFMFCLGNENMTCDDIMGEHYSDTQSEVCSDSCRALVDYKDSYYVEKCGHIVDVDVAGDACVLNF